MSRFLHILAVLAYMVVLCGSAVISNSILTRQGMAGSARPVYCEDSRFGQNGPTDYSLRGDTNCCFNAETRPMCCIYRNPSTSEQSCFCNVRISCGYLPQEQTVTQDSSSQYPYQPVYPTDPQYPYQPVYPTDPQYPYIPQYPTDPQYPYIPQYPTDPQYPYIPQYPTDPQYPYQPIYPTDPQYPYQPVYPTDPQYPYQPIYPTDPQYPYQPVYPTDPQYPYQPVYPTDPQYPTLPQYPVEPIISITPVTDPYYRPSLCSVIPRALGGRKVTQQCDFAGVANITVLGGAGITCNAVLVDGNVEGVWTQTFLTTETCSNRVDELGESLQMDVQIGNQQYPASSTFRTVKGLNGLAYIVPTFSPSPISDLGPCQKPACPLNVVTMRGLVDLNDCVLVSYGASN
ncbi:hypothetical protein EGW08_004548, partial [Elysia chlorotica]